MTIGIILGKLHHSEIGLFYRLLDLSQRQAAEHEIHHVARDLAQWSSRHVERLGEVANDYGRDLSTKADDHRASKRAEQGFYDAFFGQEHPSGLVLLDDLQSLYMAANGVSAQWLMLSQAAQAQEKTGLITLTSDCHNDTLRQVGWAKAQIKQRSAQILSS